MPRYPAPQAKNAALSAAGAVDPDSFEALEGTIRWAAVCQLAPRSVLHLCGAASCTGRMELTSA